MNAVTPIQVKKSKRPIRLERQKKYRDINKYDYTPRVVINLFPEIDVRKTPQKSDSSSKIQDAPIKDETKRISLSEQYLGSVRKALGPLLI